MALEGNVDGSGEPKPSSEPGAPSSGEPANPVSAGPFFQAPDWVTFGITALVLLVVYLCSLAPEATLQFSGSLATSAKYGGIAYPPGFPAWTVYSWFFATLVPFSNIAWRVALGSAIATALACGLVALMVSRTGQVLLENRVILSVRNAWEQNLIRNVSGFVAGMALGLSETVWREAVVVEVWSLTLLLFALMLCLFMRWMARPEHRRYLFAAVFVFGLLLTGNQEYIILLPALLLFAILADEKLGRDVALPVVIVTVTGWVLSALGVVSWFGIYYYFAGATEWLLVPFLLVGVAGITAIVRTCGLGSEWRSAGLCLASLSLGLGCYFYLPIASMTNPPENWGYPRTVEGFFHLISRGQYERPHPCDQLGRFMGQLWMLVKETWKGFGWPYVMFAVLPFWLLRFPERFMPKWILGLVFLFICVGPLQVAFLNPGLDRASAELVAQRFGPMYLVVALWTGLGLMAFASLIAKCAK